MSEKISVRMRIDSGVVGFKSIKRHLKGFSVASLKCLSNAGNCQDTSVEPISSLVVCLLDF